MPEITQGPIAGNEYRFWEDGFSCRDYPGPVGYEDVTEVTNVQGSRCFDISFTTKKGKTRKVTVILDNASQIEPLRAMLMRKVPGASAHTRAQTAWEACGTWVTTGLCLTGLVVLIIALNTWGRGATVRVPIWIWPFFMIGSFLSTNVLIGIAAAILVAFGVGAALSLRKRETVWVLSGKE